MSGWDESRVMRVAGSPSASTAFGKDDDGEVRGTDEREIRRHQMMDERERERDEAMARDERWKGDIK